MGIWMRWVILCLASINVLTEEARRNIKSPTASTKENGKPYSSGDVWRYVSTMEQIMSRRLEQMETRLNRQLNERIEQVNQSVSIIQMERLLHHVNEEISIVREQMNENSDRLKNSKEKEEDEKRKKGEIDGLKKSISKLESDVNGLRTIVERLTEEKEEEKRRRNREEEKREDTTTTSIVALQLPIDCQEACERNVGLEVQRKVFYPVIKPLLASQSFNVFCYINETGWTVIQRRIDGSVDFYRDWEDYKKGFGDLDGEFWLGNDFIYQITNQGDYRLRIEMTTWDDKHHWAEYKQFRISDEKDLYRLHVSGYSGDAGNSLSSPWENDHNGQAFSTKDNDNDNRFYDNCAEHFRGAWWFKSCFQSHLNGVYYPRGSHMNFFVRNGVQWNTIHPHSSLKHVTMMVKRNDVVSINRDISNGIE